tara:strand:- start:886 stop:1572 length:687 start_codon:yes stop_codon:yes gene_type:complete
MDAEHRTSNNISNEVIEAILNHIPFDGWSTVSLDMAAADCGLSKAEMHNLFPAGIVDAIASYGSYADQKMITAFYGQDAADIAVMPVHMKIRSLILIRLEQAAPYKEVVRRTLAALARPQHAKLASQLLYKTVDEMWRAAGDTSTNYNFYTKRATLSAVYSATLLAFLSDNSDDMAKTEAFLDRRLEDVARIPKMARPARALADTAMRFAGRTVGRFAGPIMRGRRAR